MTFGVKTVTGSETSTGKIYAQRQKAKGDPLFNLKEDNEYDKQANQFLRDTNTKFSIKYLKHDKYFAGDKESRDIYRFKLEKDGKVYSGTFGQSIEGSKNGQTPSAYDVLSSVGISANGDPNESYEDFANEFGYDQDSYSARQVHKAVLKERKGLQELYSEEERNKLSEIQ